MLQKLLNMGVIRWGLVVLFVGAIVMYMITYTVRFTETAVVTTFGSAGERSIKTEPGLYWKLPYPIQTVTKYDKRVRLIQARSETQQTADNLQIVVEGFMIYRVSDPLQFYRSFSNAGDRAIDHVRKAENDVLRDLLRSALGETSRYSVENLFSADRGASRLPELEGQIEEILRTGGEGGQALASYGIAVDSVGVDRIVLPQETNRAVIERMGAVRDRLAIEYESEGDAAAQSIRAEAEAIAEKIRTFTDRRAAEIVGQGELEAAPYLAKQNSNPQLAVYLAQLDTMRNAMAKKFTLILSEEDFGLDVFGLGRQPALTFDRGLGDVPGGAVASQPDAGRRAQPAGGAGALDGDDQ